VALNYLVEISTPVVYQQQLVLAERYQNYLISLSFYCAALTFIVCLHIVICFTVTTQRYPDFSRILRISDKRHLQGCIKNFAQKGLMGHFRYCSGCRPVSFKR